MRSVVHGILGVTGDLLAAALYGGIAGALGGSGLLLHYAAWRECAMLGLQRDAPTLTVAVLRWLGPPPQENLLLLLPSVGLGLATGILVHLWRSARVSGDPRPRDSCLP